MTVNAEVTKTDGESTINLIRRFSRRVQGASVIKLVRTRRYWQRPASRAVVRKRALKGLKRREEITDLIKRGLMAEKPKRGPRR